MPLNHLCLEVELPPDFPNDDLSSSYIATHIPTIQDLLVAELAPSVSSLSWLRFASFDFSCCDFFCCLVPDVGISM